MILDQILATKRQELEATRTTLPFDELLRRVRGRTPERNFRHALTASPRRPALIAELKRKSPSKGLLRARFDPPRLAQELQSAGAAALSVLTDEHYFGGHLDFLRDAQQFTELPVLRKDFIIDPYQIYEALAAGASAVLLIVRAVSTQQLSTLVQTAEQLRMDALVEVHDERELDTALAAGARVIGINHRDLQTFAIDLSLSTRLVPRIPSECCIVAESGLQTPADVLRMRALGVHALLIGEALMTAPSPAAKVTELFTGVWPADRAAGDA
jgi:indole-3-glycerol phosphate synthase